MSLLPPLPKQTTDTNKKLGQLERGQLKHLNPSPDYRPACFARRYFPTADPGANNLPSADSTASETATENEENEIMQAF